MTFLKRFSDSVTPEANSGCWLWTRGATADGYGVAYPGNVRSYAHRLAFESVHGEGSAAGVIVRHKCDTPACVNPEHLLGGTRLDNIRDCIERGRANRLRGEQQPFAKLTAEKVQRFRQRYTEGEEAKVFAREENLSVQTIKQVICGQTWRHVAGATPLRKTQWHKSRGLT